MTGLDLIAIIVGVQLVGLAMYVGIVLCPHDNI